MMKFAQCILLVFSSVMLVVSFLRHGELNDEPISFAHALIIVALIYFAGGFSLLL